MSQGPGPQTDLFTPSGRHPRSVWDAELRLRVVRDLADVFGTPDLDVDCINCRGSAVVAVAPGGTVVACEDPACGWHMNMDLQLDVQTP